MRNVNWKNPCLVALGVAALMGMLVLAGCDGGDGEMEEMMMPEPMGYKVTINNYLESEPLAPIVVTHAGNDALLFTADNYVTPAAQEQILTGSPAMVIAAIGEGDAVYGHGMDPKPDDETALVLLNPGKSVDIMFEQDATALRILAMVAPTIVPDNYVSAVADVGGLMAGETVTMPLSRFDIGYDEMTMDNMRLMEISLVGENAGTVTIERLGEATADDGDMMDYTATYTVEVTNELADEPLAPIVVTRVNDELYLFDGMYVTDAAKEQILTGSPMMVLAAIGEGDAVFFHGMTPKPDDPTARVLLAPGDTAPGMFETGATALRIIAMVAPFSVPDNYVTAVVNVAGLTMFGDYVMAPLTRFDIGDDEMTMDIMQTEADMDTGTVKITRQ